MPGLTLAWAADGDPLPPLALAAGHHFPDYDVRDLVVSHRLRLAFTGYPEYPLTVVEAGSVTIALEGRLYGTSDASLRATLEEIAAAALAPPPDVARLSRWLPAADGDFVLVAVDRLRERAVVLNDRHGRLPLYCHVADDRVCISRELPVVVAALPGAELDRTAVGQFLVFGYPLGDATLFAGVERLPAATLLCVPERARTTLATLHVDAREKADTGTLAERLAAGMVEATRARVAPGGKSLVALSGGIDSRMTAAALKRAAVPATAVTHSDVHGVAARDIVLAREVAEHLGLPWTLLPIGAPTGREIASLLGMKHGANYLGMSYVLPYFERLAAEHGRSAVLFTGDGGDKVLVDQHPFVRLRDDAAAAEYILRRESILTPEIAARLARCRREDLVAAVRARLASYPEPTAAERYVHFMFAERAFKFLFEGEDRNRCYLWTVTPFFAPNVFGPAMTAPDAQKARHRLRSEVLRLVGPEVADLENASTGMPLGAPAFRRRLWLEGRTKALLYRTVPLGLETWLRRRLRPPHGYAGESGFVRAVRTLVGASPAVREVLEPRVVEELLADAGGYRREQFSVILTVAALVDRLENRGRTLESLAELTFD